MEQTAKPPSTYNKIGQLLKERPDLLVHTDEEGINAVLRGDTAFIKVPEDSSFPSLHAHDVLLTALILFFISLPFLLYSRPPQLLTVVSLTYIILTIVMFVLLLSIRINNYHFYFIYYKKMFSHNTCIFYIQFYVAYATKSYFLLGFLTNRSVCTNLANMMHIMNRNNVLHSSADRCLTFPVRKSRGWTLPWSKIIWPPISAAWRRSIRFSSVPASAWRCRKTPSSCNSSTMSECRQGAEDRWGKVFFSFFY